MATQGFYETGLYRILTDLNLTSTTLKCMLLKTTAAWNPDEAVVGTSLTAAELSCTNYTVAYGGAGRKACTITGNANATDNRADFAVADQTWTTLGGASNDTIGAAALIYEDTSDAVSVPIVFWDVTNTPTNGGNITLDHPTLVAGGSLQISVGTP